MDKKYIVTNCPCYNGMGGFLTECGSDHVSDIRCLYCTDCLIKQVIEKCNDKQDLYTTKLFAEKILQLFEIEEVNNDR